MESEQRELFRLALLRVLDANSTRFGLGSKALGTLIVAYGFRPQPRELADELQYLLDKKFIESVGKAISPENAAYRINANGRDYLAEQGF